MTSYDETQISISWNVPLSNGGGLITSYKVYRYLTENTISSASLIYTATSITFDYQDTTVVKGGTYIYFVTALNADIPNGQCMAVFIRGNEQNLETRDIDAHVRFRGVGRTREAYVADSIMSADTNDNLPIIVKCNQSGSAMHPEIRGQQYKQLGTAPIEAAEAVMTRINFPAPAVAAPVPAVTPQRPPQSPNTRPASPRPNAAPAPAPAAPNGRSVFAP